MPEAIWGGTPVGSPTIPQTTGTGEPIDLGSSASAVSKWASQIFHGEFTSKEGVREALGQALFLDRPATDAEVTAVLKKFVDDIAAVMGPGVTSTFSVAIEKYNQLPETDKSLW